ncbi:MAG: GDP-mannose 4,6-dehydratase [Patescibacteria group bacterium]|nr:GDP-mannose 4,6-dehydratase [bacterium]MDZ4240722.1 GDP-mannose 4,6-dehydratase [Patescibacteria group bacterium]
MKILITGGGGFQGSHLAKHFVNKGHDVSVLTTYSEFSENNLADILGKITIIWGSITDRETVDKSVRGHDVVFHLAGHVNVDESLQDPGIFLQVNVLGTFNILEAVKKYKNRLIAASTCEVYGDGHTLKDEELLSETAELKPNSPYAASKAAADRLSYAYYRSFGVDVTIARPFNVFGEKQNAGPFGALIPILVARGLQGKDLTVFGTGESTRDYSHVSDIVQAYDLVFNTKGLAGKAINFASGKDTKIKDIADYIAKKFNVKVVHGPARPGEVSRFPADISFAKSLGYVPKTSIWEGIDQYIDWAKKESRKKTS